MKLKTILSILAVAILAVSGLIVSCSPAPSDDGGTGGDGQQAQQEGITIIFDFTDTILPESVPVPGGAQGQVYRVVPFIVGDLKTQVNSNKFYNWGDIVYGGIRPNGTGSHVLTKIDAAKWKFFIAKSDILADPETPTAVEFKAANYNPSDWANIINITTNTNNQGEVVISTNVNFWNTVGNQLTGENNERIVISNYAIIEAYKPGDTNYAVKPGENTNGIELSSDGKTITIKVSNHGGWSAQLYAVTNLQLTIISSNVATTNVAGNTVSEYGYRGTFTSWGEGTMVNATILGTNDNGTVIVSATFTYNGPAGVNYKVMGKVGDDWKWATDNDQAFLIPIQYTNNAKYTNAENRAWNFQ